MREDMEKLRGLVLSHNQVKSLVQFLTITVKSFHGPDTNTLF